MRKLVLLLTATMLSLALSVEAQNAYGRLFWQTHGSVTTDGGCGCAWNVNQDYFVPRHCHTGRYGLFSPCKTSCTSSPACKHCHPFYYGYCSNYGPCHYCWRNHVYRCYCGCNPLRPHGCSCSPTPYCGPWLYGCRAACRGACGNQSSYGYSGVGLCAPIAHEWPYRMPAPNVEPAGMQVIGGLPIQGDELLASMGVTLETEQLPQPVEQVEEGFLPSLGLPTP